MPKLESAEEKLRKKGILGKSVDLDPNWYSNHLKAEAKAKEEARKKEEDRISKLCCPLCGSTSKLHIIKSGSNDIIGPGYRSWVIDEYYVCEKCGIMFRDLTTLKNERNK